MAIPSSHVVEVLPSLFQEDAADNARNLIMANELYKASNQIDNAPEERATALQQASELTADCLQETPNMPAALSLMARIRMDQHRLDEAESLIRKALDVSSDNENIQLNYAYVLMAKGQFDLAEAQFMHVLTINAHSYQAFSGIALAKLKKGDHGAAFVHYQRLLELGYQHDIVKHHFLQSAQYVVAGEYKESLAQLCLSAFSWTDVDHQSVSGLASSLLIHKYDLLSDSAQLDINLLARDELLIELLCKTAVQNIHIEKLAGLLRRSILEESVLSAHLREPLIPLVIALGLASIRSEFVWHAAVEEENLVDLIESLISDSCLDEGFELNDIAGALMVYAMYRSSYEASIKVHLLAYSVEDWPLAMQDLIQANLFDPSYEHQGQYDLFGSRLDVLLDKSIRRASNRWTTLPPQQQISLGLAMNKLTHQRDIPVRFYDHEVDILIVGCGSGQRAIQLAQSLKNVQITAIDDSQENIAYAFQRAAELDLDNISFSCHALDITLEKSARFDMIEFGEAINSVQNPLMVIRQWLKLLSEDGFVRMLLHTEHQRDKTDVVHQLVQSRRLSPTADNIRHLRYAITEESAHNLWDRLLDDKRFYTATGCRDLFFCAHQHFYDFDRLEALLYNSGLDLIGSIPSGKTEPTHAYAKDSRTQRMRSLKDQLGKQDLVEIYGQRLK